MVLAWMVHRNGVTRAYPWRDFNQMPRDRKITSWPFYCLADPSNNPTKKVLFTPAYLDPLSREWMISCLYPVYVRGRFEATIGINLTIENLLREVSGIRLPKGASSLLLTGDDFVALGKKVLSAERDFNTRAGFTKHHDRLLRFFNAEPLAPHNIAFLVKDEDLDEVFNW